jgi:hypothetical protein
MEKKRDRKRKRRKRKKRRRRRRKRREMFSILTKLFWETRSLKSHPTKISNKNPSLLNKSNTKLENVSLDNLNGSGIQDQRHSTAIITISSFRTNLNSMKNSYLIPIKAPYRLILSLN